MAVSLGFAPIGLKVILTPGSTFAAKLTNSSGDWDVGASVSLTFDVPDPDSDIEWTATLAGADATWTEAPAAVQAVLDAGVKTVRLWYSDGTNPVEWGYGSVVVKP